MAFDRMVSDKGTETGGRHDVEINEFAGLMLKPTCNSESINYNTIRHIQKFYDRKEYIVNGKQLTDFPIINAGPLISVTLLSNTWLQNCHGKHSACAL